MHPPSASSGIQVRQLVKVTFVGAHGTGKTTLVNALAERINSLGLKCSVTPEVPRIICETAGDITYFRRDNNSLSKQILLLVGQPIYEVAAAAGGMAVLLCDRAILDHWAYTRYLFMKELEDEQALSPLNNLIAKHCQSYDFIFYVPIEFAPLDDGTREGDQDFQNAIDAQIRELLKMYGLTYHTISGTVSERVAQVMKVLNLSV
ncbi:MAG TPA: ATP-binding protein [Nitrososphaera sp.]|jgi:nicotinamide riboside kinase|nr:ATP-binding protein [Nitrososphaera sp.]